MNNPGAQNWGRIPGELKALRRWAVCGASLNAEEPKAPHYVGNNGQAYRVAVTNPDKFMDFESAAQFAWQHPDVKIGFILCAGDGFTCIDMDVKNASNEPNPAKWTPQDHLNRMWAMVQTYECYTERSQSGMGLHVWVRGEVGKGRKRDGIEMYSQERFIICTGDVVLQHGIYERGELLTNTYSQLQPKVVGTYAKLVDLEPQFDDAYIWTKLVEGGNAEKFKALCNCVSSYGEGDRKVLGSFTELGYPSQSEADLALMSMFTFYSRSNIQCRRMFRQTGLGQRPKAQKDDRHLNLMLSIIRARQEREDENTSRAADAAESMIALYRKAQGEPEVLAPEVDSSIPANIRDLVVRLQQGNYLPGAHDQISSQSLAAAPMAAARAQLAPVEAGALPWPPGFAGALADFIYRSAPRPVREVAIVATLGLLAGVCGKSFAIPGSGLNLYVVLVARSAIGKEAMHSGISALVNAVRQVVPAAANFVDFTQYASGPALIKACLANNSFCNVSGEWGRKLQRLAVEDGRDGPMQQLRSVMTDLYQKSGPGSTVGGVGYSNKDNNVASVASVAYSMIGETTPDTYYRALTESMMEDGFMSRFTVIEYTGARPEANEYAVRVPDQPLTDALVGLATHSLTLTHRGHTEQVNFDLASTALMKAFDRECDSQINSTDVESWRQMWNRAHLKALRLAALLAVADNWLQPVVNEGHATWALDVIRRDINMMQRRMETGDVGSGDTSRSKKLIAFMQEYLSKPPSDGYKIPKEMWQAGIVPRKYLQVRCGRVAAFTQHKAGCAKALDETLRTLVEDGHIRSIPKDRTSQDYKFFGQCYHIVNI